MSPVSNYNRKSNVFGHSRPSTQGVELNFPMNSSSNIKNISLDNNLNENPRKFRISLKTAENQRNSINILNNYNANPARMSLFFTTNRKESIGIPMISNKEIEAESFSNAHQTTNKNMHCSIFSQKMEISSMSNKVFFSKNSNKKQGKTHILNEYLKRYQIMQNEKVKNEENYIESSDFKQKLQKRIKTAYLKNTINEIKSIKNNKEMMKQKKTKKFKKKREFRGKSEGNEGNYTFLNKNLENHEKTFKNEKYTKNQENIEKNDENIEILQINKKYTEDLPENQKNLNESMKNTSNFTFKSLLNEKQWTGDLLKEYKESLKKKIKNLEKQLKI